MTGRKRSVAETVTELPAAITKTVIEALTPDQRRALTVDQAGRIGQLSSVYARAIGYVLESPAGKFTLTVREEKADGET